MRSTPQLLTWLHRGPVCIDVEYTADADGDGSQLGRPRHLMKKIKYLFSSPPISSAVDRPSPLISSAVDRPSPPISSAGLAAPATEESWRHELFFHYGWFSLSLPLRLHEVFFRRGVFQRRPRKKRYILWFEEFSSLGGNPQRVREKEMEREGRARQREERE